MGRAVLLALAMALLVGVGDASAGEERLKRVAGDLEFFDADGGRYAVWGKDSGTTIEVLDTTDDRRFSVPKPSECRSPYAESGGRLLGGSQLMLACGPNVLDPATRFVLVDILSGAVRDVPRDLPEAGAVGVLWDSVGRHWIEGLGECADRECTVRLNLATGRSITQGTDRPQSLRDLDDPDLRAVCDSRGFATEARESEGPYLLRADRRDRLLLRRCGRRTVDLGKFKSSAIAGPLAVATSSTSLFAYEIRERRRHRWRVPRRNRVARQNLLRPMATRDAALVAVASREQCNDADCFPASYDLYEARLRPPG